MNNQNMQKSTHSLTYPSTPTIFLISYWVCPKSSVKLTKFIEKYNNIYIAKYMHNQNIEKITFHFAKINP